MKKATALLVESDFDRRFEIGGWLEAAGYEVLACPGPRSPDYTCLAKDEGRCPLATAADVVVLNMHQASDDAMQGTPGWELLLYYLLHEKRVVAISGEPDSLRPKPDQGVAVLRRPAEKHELLGALRRLLREPKEGGDRGDDLAG